MSYNPDLGQPYGFETSLATAHVNSSSNLHLPSGMTESTRHLPAIAEPSTTSDTLVNHTGSESSQHRSTVPNQPSTSPPPAPLSHIRSAPITFPVNPAAHQPNAAQERDNVARMTSNDSTDGSPTPTIQGSNDDHQGVPLAAGGLHGQPLPGSKARDGEITEKDPQAAGMGGKTGPGIAALGAAVLEVNKDGEYDEKSGKWESPASSVDDIKKIERTISGTVIPPRANTAAGGQTVQGLGMVPVTNRESRAPYVGFFGGVAPSGADAEEGLTVARSLGEEEEREAERERKGGPDPWSVRFDPGEKGNPKNWSQGYRWYLTGVAGLLVLNSTFASSAPSGIIGDMEKYFGFGREVGILTLSLFVAGYTIGPLLWGPLSESYGRRPVFLASFLVYTGWQVGCALSKNTASILIFRFLSGCFASAPLTNSGALLADIWDNDHRGQSMAIFALAPFAGPSLGPIVGGFISVTGTDWRWMYWVLTLFAGFCFLVIVFTVPETYAPQLLLQKAKRLRKETGEQRWFAPLERVDHSWKARLNDILLKPFIMLGLEPMLLAVTLYMSFVYGVVYLLFEAYPFVFTAERGFNTGEEGLIFLGFFLGGFLSVVFFLTVIEPRFQRYLAKVHPRPPEPERRLELCIISGWTMVIAFFWFAWTSYPSIHWISPTLAGTFLGFSVLGMFVSLFNYVIDVYLWTAASALAATTVTRSVFGAVFPLFATQMYAKLGTHWASSLLGFIALLMAPIPMILFRFGQSLRQRSRFAPNKM